MKVIKKTSCPAFTLIELLVVIAIIALLLAILVPALGKAKMYAQRLLCASNIRQQCIGVRLYSEQNDGTVPIQKDDPGFWLWDMSFWTTNQISQYAGIDYPVFFCAANSSKKATDARCWQFSWVDTNPAEWGVTKPIMRELPHHDEKKTGAPDPMRAYRVLPQIYMFDKLDVNGNSRLPTTLVTGEKAVWIRKLTDLRNASAKIMIMDAVISDRNDWNFDDIRTGGSWTSFQLADSSNHFVRQSVDSTHPNKKPWGANVGYADGHAQWQEVGPMNSPSIKHRLTFGQWFWW